MTPSHLPTHRRLAPLKTRPSFRLFQLFFPPFPENFVRYALVSSHLPGFFSPFTPQSIPPFLRARVYFRFIVFYTVLTAPGGGGYKLIRVPRECPFSLLQAISVFFEGFAEESADTCCTHPLKPTLSHSLGWFSFLGVSYDVLVIARFPLSKTRLLPPTTLLPTGIFPSSPVRPGLLRTSPSSRRFRQF